MAGGEEEALGVEEPQARAGFGGFDALLGEVADEQAGEANVGLGDINM